MLAATAVGVHGGKHELPLFESFERRTLDLRFIFRGTAPRGDEIVLIGFDDHTLTRAPRLFDRRAGWARLLAAVRAAGPRAIGVDALFSGDEEVLPPELSAAIDRHLAPLGPTLTAEADQLLVRVSQETRGDAELARVIGDAGNVVLGLHLGSSREGDRAPAATIARGKYGQVVPGVVMPHEVLAVTGSNPALNAKAKALGFLSVYEDEAQSLRSVALARSYEQSVFAAFSVQLVALFRGVGRAGIAYLGNDAAIQIGEQRVPLGDDDDILLNWRGPPGTFPILSAIDVLDGTVPPERLRGKIVLVGVTQLGQDTTRTSFGPGMPGLEMHATAIDNLLRADPLTRAPTRTDVLIALGLGVFIAFIFWPRLGLPVWGQSLAALAALALYLGISQYFFVNKQLWLPALGPSFTCALVALVGLALGYAREGLERRRVRSAFAHYLSDGLIEELLTDPAALSLGGARRRLTVLFSDIRGFTSIAEKLEPEQLVRVLNAYLTPMTRAVLREGGLVDKFIGDAVMAFFGAPVPHPDHAARALRAALGMHAALETLQPTLSELGVRIDIGVGVNTGEMAVGNMGSEERFNYTVMGDAVNLGSRLEGLTKTYGVFCIVGQEARAAAGEGFSFRELDLVKVKGKAEPTTIYELTAGPGRILVEHRDAARFADGVLAYRAGRFDEARAAFSKFSAANPSDVPTRVYLARIEELGSVAPDGWRGVHVFDRK